MVRVEPEVERHRFAREVGLAVGRGAFISVILVLSVLPQLLVLLDGAVEKTRFRLSLQEEET